MENSRNIVVASGSYGQQEYDNMFCDVPSYNYLEIPDDPYDAYIKICDKIKSGNDLNFYVHSLSGGLILKILKENPYLLNNIQNLIISNSCCLSEEKFSQEEHKNKFIQYLFKEILTLNNPIFNIRFLHRALSKVNQDPIAAQKQLDFIINEKFYEYVLQISERINILILESKKDIAFPISTKIKHLVTQVDSDHFMKSNSKEVKKVIFKFLQNNIDNNDNNYDSENIPNISEKDIQVWKLKFRDFYQIITGRKKLTLKNNYNIPSKSTDQEGTESYVDFKDNQVLKVFKDYFPKPIIQGIFAICASKKSKNSKMWGSKEMFEARKNDFDYLGKIIPKYLPEYKFEEKENNFQLQQEKINGITLQDFFDQFKNQESIQEYLQKKENLTLRNGLLDLIWASKKVFQITGGVYLDFFAKKDGLSNIIIKENTQEPFLVDPGLITFYASVLQVSNKILSAPVKENMQQEKEIQQYIEKLCNPSEQEKNILNLKYQIHNE